MERLLFCIRKISQKLAYAISDNEDEMGFMEEEFEKLETAKSEADSLVEALREEINELNHQKASQDVILQLSDNDRALLVTKCSEKDTEIDQCKQEIAKISQQLELQSSNVSLLEEKTRLLNQCESLNAEQQRSEAEADQYKQEVLKLSQQLRDLESSNASRLEEQNSSVNQLKSLQAEHQHESELGSLREEFSSLQNLYEEAKKEVSSLRHIEKVRSHYLFILDKS